MTKVSFASPPPQTFAVTFHRFSFWCRVRATQSAACQTKKIVFLGLNLFVLFSLFEFVFLTFLFEPYFLFTIQTERSFIVVKPTSTGLPMRDMQTFLEENTNALNLMFQKSNINMMPCYHCQDNTAVYCTNYEK